jgi:hypothetical protein
MTALDDDACFGLAGLNLCRQRSFSLYLKVAMLYRHEDGQHFVDKPGNLLGNPGIRARVVGNATSWTLEGGRHGARLPPATGRDNSCCRCATCHAQWVHSGRTRCRPTIIQPGRQAHAGQAFILDT